MGTPTDVTLSADQILAEAFKQYEAYVVVTSTSNSLAPLSQDDFYAPAPVPQGFAVL